jgi:hypothetical protein
MIIDFENGSRTPIASNLVTIRAALEAFGVIFFEENGEGPGVSLRKARRTMRQDHSRSARWEVIASHAGRGW